MKTKKDFPFLTLFIASAVSVAAFLPLRIYQYFKILEPDTGFYNDIDFSVYIMYGLMLFVTVFNIIMSFINKKNLSNRDDTAEKSGAVAYIIAAVGFIIDAIEKAVDFIEINNDYVYNFQQSVTEYLSSNGAIIFIVQAVFAIISALYFFALAAAKIANKDFAPSLKIVALAPSLWAAMRLLYRFKSTISFTNVSDLLLELFAIVFMMMFFFAYAQTLSKVDKGENYWKVFAYGIPAAVFGLACFVPRAILSVIGHSDLIAEGFSPEVCDFTVAIMILGVLISKVTVKLSEKKN